MDQTRKHKRKKTQKNSSNRAKKDYLISRRHKREIRSYLLAQQRRALARASLKKYFKQSKVLKFLSFLYNSSSSVANHVKRTQNATKLKETIVKIKRKNKTLKFKCNYWKDISFAKSKDLKKLVIENKRLKYMLKYKSSV